MLTSLMRKPGSMLGIDINSTSINILELSNDKGLYRVEGYGRAIVSDPDVDAMINIIKSLLSTTNTSSRRVVLALHDSYVITKTTQVNAQLQDQDLEEWVYMEAEKYIPYPLDEINLDFNITGISVNNSDLLDILIVASRAFDVEQRVDMLRRAGFITQIVDVESFAIERAFQLLPCQERYCALFNIGQLVMDVLVFHEKRIIFSREDMLLGDESQEAILLQIKRSLEYCASTIYPACIEKIILAGELTDYPDLTSFVQEDLGIPTQIANPFARMEFATSMLREKIEKDAPLLMVACGLALDNQKIHINLLPWRKTRLHDLKKRFSLCLLASFLIAIIGVILIQYKVMHLTQQQVLINQQLEHERLHLENQIKEVSEYSPG